MKFSTFALKIYQLTGRTLLVCMMALLFANSTKAQSGNWNFGLKVGANLGNVINSDPRITYQYQMEPDLAFGGVVNYQIHRLLAVQPELLYSVKGYSFEGLNEYGKGRFQYLDIPLMAQLRPKGFLLEGGLVYSLLLNHKEYLSMHSYQTEGGEGIRKSDLGYAVGGGIVIKEWYTLSARYMRSFGNIVTGKRLPLSNNLQHSVVQVTFGVQVTRD